jgi:hypothetical protein
MLQYAGPSLDYSSVKLSLFLFRTKKTLESWLRCGKPGVPVFKLRKYKGEELQKEKAQHPLLHRNLS